MAEDESRAREELSALSSRLGLSDESQDWGIVNADARRLSEFVRFFESEPSLTSEQQSQMAGLILASANEALRNDESAQLDELKAFLSQHPDAAALDLEYWSSLEDDELFPLAIWLRSEMG